MPSVQVLVPPTAAAEPVSLAQVNAWCRLDLNAELVAAYDAGSVPSDADPALVAQLEILQITAVAAREKVESYTGRYFAPQTLALTYTLEEPYLLPSGAEATEVTGFYTSLDALAASLEEYRKGISVSRELPWDIACQQTYTVTVTTTGDTQYQGLAKSAILELTGEWFRNREASSIGTISPELPVNYRTKLAPARITPIGH